MTARVYIEIQSSVSGGVLLIRNKIQALNPEIEWLYDDAVQVLEMEGYHKWWNADIQLQELSRQHSELGLSWEIAWE